ncbi:hypothetical protein [Alterisphingorhabdus coralli]|uniref:Uncharacterized protein n=1 Tax=Alterisphingorhabdus coralli TaxID=3071408 RepID=A0AA97FAT0_9SPHN|nr:hypothetical protein [Parasphingorhabdus sp. SCSIO 66989]WOE76343.1 hypothetical protein RB602_06420 [Parasphingorhabdus sp. SCSIO 66989]
MPIRLSPDQLQLLVHTALGKVPISLRQEYHEGDREAAEEKIAAFVVSELDECEFYHRGFRSGLERELRPAYLEK